MAFLGGRDPRMGDDLLGVRSGSIVEPEDAAAGVDEVPFDDPGTVQYF